MSRRVRIAGIGKYLPERVVASAELEARHGIEAGWIARKTGVVTRRYLGPQETQASMGAAAARAALDDAGAALSDVNLVLSASACYQQPIPCNAVLIQRELDLAHTGVPCFDVNSTCLSFLHALEVAAHFVDSGAYGNVLVVSSEAPSTVLDWREPESAALLGDGAAAVLLTRARDDEASVLYRAAFTTDSRGAELAMVPGGGTAHHPNAEESTPDMMLFHMEGRQIFRFAQRMAVPFIARYAQTLPFPLASIEAVCAHQASLSGLRLVTRACGFAPEQVLENIETHGNCVAASIPMVLHDGVRAGRIERGDRVLMAGTAAGLAVGAMALVY